LSTGLFSEAVQKGGIPLPIDSLQQHWRKFLAAAALALSLAMCAIAGQMNASVTTLSNLPDGSTSQARLNYLSSLGWTVDSTERSEQVVLPETFGAAYSEYLAIQEECGFDLTACAGETVTRYSYFVTNYPSGEENIQLDLLVSQGLIVGGDVRSSSLDGFMHSLNYPKD
jgi:hypothetical protein